MADLFYTFSQYCDDFPCFTLASYSTKWSFLFQIFECTIYRVAFYFTSNYIVHPSKKVPNPCYSYLDAIAHTWNDSLWFCDLIWQYMIMIKIWYYNRTMKMLYHNEKFQNQCGGAQPEQWRPRGWGWFSGWGTPTLLSKTGICLRINLIILNILKWFDLTVSNILIWSCKTFWDEQKLQIWTQQPHQTRLLNSITASNKLWVMKVNHVGDLPFSIDKPTK